MNAAVAVPGDVEKRGAGDAGSTMSGRRIGANWDTVTEITVHAVNLTTTIKRLH
jgi:hypothetical protein